MKFSGKMCLVVMLKATKKQGLTLSIENAVSEKPQGGVRLTTPSLLRVNEFI